MVCETPRVYITAIKKSSGKTLISIALNRALYKKGLAVQPFKKGPDFIDPMWHSRAAGGKSCRNLDFFFMSKGELLDYFIDKSKGADIAVLEGNHGLFDDINIKGGTDNASLAKLLKTPVIIVLDVKEMGRSVIPIILGCIDFDKDLNIAGIILNKVQSPRQEKRLVGAINFYTNIPVLGSIPESKQTFIPQRHLGLFSTLEEEKKEEIISEITSYFERYINIEGIISIARASESLSTNTHRKNNLISLNKRLRLGLALDKVFNFYYHDNIEFFEKCGFEIVPFSPLNSELPNVNALYIGGGFPELFLDELEANQKLREQIKSAIDDGMPVYAECGGLIYLTNFIRYKDKVGQLVGAINANTEFKDRPVGHGYTVLSPHKNGWWSDLNNIAGHEFHHAKVEGDVKKYAFEVRRGYGVDGRNDGIIVNNMLASFTHIFAPSSDFFYQWAKFIRQVS